MRLEGQSGERWYMPLVEPVRPSVDAALGQLNPVHDDEDAWSLPRAGLGGAVAIQVARGFGLRKWRRAGRAAVVALEGYNQRIHVGEPSDEDRARWLARDISWALRVWEKVLIRDDALLRRVMDRLLGGDAAVVDNAIPEAVLFLRAAVAAGVTVGDVPDDVHGVLDRHATWLGLAWEADRGPLTAEAWRCALRAVGVHGEAMPADAETYARARARDSLGGLPETEVVRLLEGILENAPTGEPIVTRAQRAWEPMRPPTLEPERAPGARLDGIFGEFTERWRAPVERALAELLASGSDTIGCTTTYLLGQGGKRIRPVLTIASATAAGVAPGRALGVAAAVEWLHQGSLLLDDIIDEAPLRRGAASLHAATTKTFAAGVAVFVFARVLRSLHGMHPDIRAHLVRAAVALAEGERLELAHTGDAKLSQTRYYKIIHAKTARVFSCAAAVGALAVEAPGRRVRALARYGREIGLAFQIVDDVLDYTGDQTRLGKQPGTDLRAGKMTLPLIVLRDRLERAERERLARALGDATSFGWVRRTIEDHGIADECLARASKHVERATAALSAVPDGEGKQVLEALAHQVVSRRC